ncbi:MAG: flagellar hook-associated protein FlgL [Oceanospirillaceae bacterium]|nr:flagellar hook-associated protein FlgL [Oceanospirillaceae bacterium]
MLRVTTQQQYLNSIDNMQRSNVSLDRLQQQIATGKRVLQPSDDPVAAAQILKLERELAQYDKYDINIKVTDRRLTLQESVMDSIRNSMNRVKELVVQGSTGTLTDADRGSIAVSLRTETEFMASLMNTQDSQGEYIFAGSKGHIQPYQLQSDGSFAYQGDDGQRKIQVSSELYIPSNDSGQYLFEAVSADLQTTIKGTYASESPVSTPVVTNTVFDSQALQDQFSAATAGLGDLTVTVTTGPLAYSVTDSSGVAVNDSSGSPITGILFTTGDEVDLFGMKMTLVTPPLPAFTDNNVNVIHTEPEQKNILDIVQDYAKALETPLSNQAKRDDFAAATVKVFEQWDQASERNLESITRLGTRLSFLETVQTNNLDFTLFATVSLSAIQDVDLAEAISKFKLEEITLQASQAVFGRISALSLFDYIN